MHVYSCIITIAKHEHINDFDFAMRMPIETSKQTVATVRTVAILRYTL